MVEAAAGPLNNPQVGLLVAKLKEDGGPLPPAELPALGSLLEDYGLPFLVS